MRSDLARAPPQLLRTHLSFGHPGLMCLPPLPLLALGIEEPLDRKCSCSTSGLTVDLS